MNHSTPHPPIGASLRSCFLAFSLLSLLVLAVAGCSSKEENEARAAMKQMMQGCLSSGAPEKVCQCTFEDPGIVSSAIRLSENRADEEMRVTFTSKLHAQVAHCAEKELGITPDDSQSQAQRRFLENLIPRK